MDVVANIADVVVFATSVAAVDTAAAGAVISVVAAVYDVATVGV